MFIKSVLGAATAEEQATLDAFDGQFEVPYNFDAWDGYQVEREMILRRAGRSRHRKRSDLGR